MIVPRLIVPQGRDKEKHSGLQADFRLEEEAREQSGDHLETSALRPEHILSTQCSGQELRAALG